MAPTLTRAGQINTPSAWPRCWPVGAARTHAECQYRFLRAVWDGTEPSPGLDDGLRVQRLVDAVYRSHEHGNWIDATQSA